MIYALTL